ISVWMTRDAALAALAKRPKASENAFLICDGEPRIADHVGGQNRGELPGLCHCSGRPALRSSSNANWSTGLCFTSYVTERLGLRRRASAMAAFASSISPLNAAAAAKLR